MITVLNIGLGPSTASPAGTPLGDALDAVCRTCLEVGVEFRTVTKSEPTVVVTLRGHVTPQLVYRLSEKIGQDCIAAMHIADGYQHGFLAGPEAAAWGKFDLSKFIFPRSSFI